MRKLKLIVVGVIVVIIIIFFPAHIFGKMDIIKSIEGYHLEDNYSRQNTIESKYLLPGMWLTEIKADENSTALEAATYRYIASNYDRPFNVGDAVSIYSDNSGSSSTENIIHLRGIVSSIDQNYIPINNEPSIRYTIKIPNLRIDSLDLLSGGSMAHTSEDGDAVAIDHRSIRNIGDKKYVCIITESIGQDQLIGGTTYIIKFALKEIKTGTRTYTNSDAFNYLIEVSGLSPRDEIVTSTTSSNGSDFDCTS